MTAKLTYASSNSSMIHQVYTKASTTEPVFGYLILISTCRGLQWLRSLYVKIQRLTTHPNTRKSVKNTPLCVILLTIMSVFVNVARSSLSCLIYYMNRMVDCNKKLTFLRNARCTQFLSGLLSSIARDRKNALKSKKLTLRFVVYYPRE